MPYNFVYKGVSYTFVTYVRFCVCKEGILQKESTLTSRTDKNATVVKVQKCSLYMNSPSTALLCCNFDAKYRNRNIRA